MIDGAHVLTPGVLQFGLAGLRTYAPAIVATQQWYVGPGQQGDAMDDGYDQAYEDRLFDASTGRTPATGSSRSATSSAIATGSTACGRATACSSRARCSSRSAASTRASRCRAAATRTSSSTSASARHPTSPSCTIIGEGSFHQVHGGVTTNQADADERRPQDLRLQRALRRASRPALPRARQADPLRRPSQVSGCSPLTSPPPDRGHLRAGGADARAGRPADVTGPHSRGPAFELHRSGVAQPRVEANHLARPAHRERADRSPRVPASDRLRPPGLDRRDRHRTTARARCSSRRSASCSVTARSSRSARTCPRVCPLHPRITYLDGVADDEATLTRVRDLVGPASTTLVVLGSRVPAEATRRIFAAYAPLVTVGSYLIVTDTIVNGNPVWTGFGPGPMEALKLLLQRHGEFFADPGAGALRADVQSRRLPEADPMKIFCIGLNKTGTRSLSDALEILGYRSLHWGGSDAGDRAAPRTGDPSGRGTSARGGPSSARGHRRRGCLLGHPGAQHELRRPRCAVPGEQVHPDRA